MAAAAVSIGVQHVAFWVALVDSPKRFPLGTILNLAKKCVVGKLDMLCGQNKSINQSHLSQNVDEWHQHPTKEIMCLAQIYFLSAKVAELVMQQ